LQDTETTHQKKSDTQMRKKCLFFGYEKGNEAKRDEVGEGKTRNEKMAENGK